MKTVLVISVLQFNFSSNNPYKYEAGNFSYNIVLPFFF